jgi:hypothetical protein
MKNEQDTKQKLPYETPALTVMGKVERLTALGFRGPKDIVAFKNLL